MEQRNWSPQYWSINLTTKNHRLSNKIRKTKKNKSNLKLRFSKMSSHLWLVKSSMLTHK